MRSALLATPPCCYIAFVRNCPQCSAECSGEHRFCPACGFPVGALRTAAGDPLIGRTLGGAYVILENIGSGGMGRVYRAEQASLGKTLAVKVIHPHLISDESATSRFYTEARASSRLNHPNSVSVLDFGRTDDGLLYLVMEFLRGKDLAHILWEQGPLPAVRAANILRQVLAALSEAHDLGIIHRDIKPENILIEPLRTGGDFCKVVDFGLAKVRADVAPSVTMPGIVCGTPDYMAPEQGRGDPLDPRSDLYSCGVLLFQTLTGRLPFEAESPTQIVLMHMTDPPPDPRSIITTIPQPIADATLKALSKDPADRHQSAVEFAEALSEAIRESEAIRSSNKSPGVPAQPCPSCGAPLAGGVKFCGECGARVPASQRRAPSVAPRPRASERPSAPTQAEQPRSLTFVGRDEELARLDTARTRAASGRMVAVRLQGETGIGKHRLVAAFVERSLTGGDAVVTVGPDVSWAGVAYSPVAACVRRCLGLAAGDDPIAWLDTPGASRSGGVDRAIRAGFEELFTEPGALHLEGRARREAVVRALIYAMGAAATSATSGIAVVAFEDLHRMDTASQAVLTALTCRTVPVSVLLLGSHTPRIDPRWLNSDAIALRGLSRDSAQQAIDGMLTSAMPDANSALDQAGDEIAPLYIDQVARWVIEGGGPPPPRLVDVVSARFERLAPRARRAVQALALLGEATAAMMTRLLGEEFDPTTATSLRLQGWTSSDVRANQEWLQLTHPLLREVAESSIPAAARNELHGECAQLLADAPVAIEARAIHAADSGDPFQALVLLERVGDQAIARGDDLGAAHALRRGLERARRELVRGDIDEPERAMSIFARKLADALMRAGEAAEAEGVLREAIELVPRTNVEWARLEGALARALYARGRTPDAMRAIDEAIKTARRLAVRVATVELLLVRAELEESLGNSANAATHLKSAEETVREAVQASAQANGRNGGTSVADDRILQKLRIEVLIRLARALRLAGDDMGAGEPLDEARAIAHRLALLTERNRCDAEGAERAEQLGDRRAAAASWRRAAQGARDAGDALNESLFQERERRLGAMPAQAGAG